MNMTIQLIDGFDTLTPQQVFDMALKHVRSSKKKSTLNDVAYGQCTYSGIGCAASVFLKDEGSRIVADTLGTSGWIGLVRQEDISRHNDGLISKIQCCHDVAAPHNFMENFEASMEYLAKEEELLYTPE